jgi:molybdate/tungstate transport system substrate-binding protein
MNMNKRKSTGIPLLTRVILVFAVLTSLCLPGCSGQNTNAPDSFPSKLVLFEAGSLMVPFARVSQEFTDTNPGMPLDIQAHGSIQVCRYVTDLEFAIDIVAVADYSLIPLIMYGTQMPDSQGPYADWSIKFATNKLVLAYSPTGKYAGELNAANWYKILARGDVKIGLANPQIDAVGYRAMMLAKLAEMYYKDGAIFDDLFARSFTSAIKVEEENGVSVISVPQLLEPQDKRIILRGSSVQIVALIQSGDVDFAFEYLSVARQQGLKYIELPPEIDMGSDNYAAVYQKVRVKLDFRRFKYVEPVFDGLPIVYALSIPRNAPHPKEAVAFIKFLLGKDGERIFNDTYQPLLRPPLVDNRNNLPAELKPLFE